MTHLCEYLKKTNFSMNYFVLVNFSNIRFLGPHFCCRGYPLGPHFTQNWVPIQNMLGPHSMWEQWVGSIFFIYKEEVVFYKKAPFSIKIADFVNFSILEGKKRVISANVIDPIFLYCNVFGCYMHNLLILWLKIEFFIKSA